MFFTDLKAWIVKRLPSTQQVAAVYGVIVLIVYGWTLYWFAWKLPSWLYFLSVGEMLVALAYSMVVNLIESLIVLFALLLLCAILPPRWFRDRFTALGTVLVILSMIALAYYLGAIIALQDFPPHLRWYVLLAVAGIALVVFLVSRVKFLVKFLEEIANRAVIFLYVFLPLSAISFIVVLIRNVIEAFHV